MTHLNQKNCSGTSARSSKPSRLESCFSHDCRRFIAHNIGDITRYCTISHDIARYPQCHIAYWQYRAIYPMSYHISTIWYSTIASRQYHILHLSLCIRCGCIQGRPCLRSSAVTAATVNAPAGPATRAATVTRAFASAIFSSSHNKLK